MNRGGRPRKSQGTVFQRGNSKYWWVRYRDRRGRLVKESANTVDRTEAERFLRDRLDARDDGRLAAVLRGKRLTFNEWADWFLEKRSKPPYRAEKTHQANLEVLTNLRPIFGTMKLAEIATETIEEYLENRMKERRRIRTKFGIEQRGRLKPSTVHREFRVLRRILSVAVKQKRLTTNPCSLVEFPASISSTTRKPHYMTASEQERIEFLAPDYLRDAIVILVETGLRPYRELTPMLKAQVDLENGVAHISDSKTESGVADLPLTDRAREAVRRRIEATPGSDYLFPSLRATTSKPHLRSFAKAWASALERAGVPHFSIYELRHTFATRLSAGGVADHFVTQMLRQGDSAVFKRYSHAKLNMMRQALGQINRQANESASSSGTAQPN